MPRPVLPLIALSACTAEVVLPPPWDPGLEAALVVSDLEDQPLEAAPRVLPAGAAHLELPFTQPLRLHAFTFLPDPSASGRDLAGCGLAFGGDGEEPGRSAGAWVAGPVRDGAEPPSFQAADPPVDFALRYARCARPRYPCEAAELTLLPAPGGLGDINPGDAIALDDARGFVTLRALRAPHGSPLLAQIEAETVLMLANDMSYLGEVRSLTAAAGRVLGATSRGKVFEMEADGTVTTSVTVGPEREHLALARGTDGTVLAYGMIGVRVWRMGAQAVDVSALTALGGPVEQLALEDPRHVMAVARQAFHHFDGSRWVLERDQRPSAFEQIRSVAAGGGRVLAAGRYAIAFERGEDGVWRDLPAPPDFEGGDIQRVEYLGEDRFLAVGDGGWIGVLDRGAWCRVPNPWANIVDVASVAPGGRSALLVARDAAVRVGDPPLFLRLRLP